MGPSAVFAQQFGDRRRNNKKYEVNKDFPNFIGLTSTGDGTIASINPQLDFVKNSNAIFDLSDSSLSYTISATSYPAFHFNFFKDSKFNERYETSGFTESFDVSRTGTIGVTGDAKVTLKVNENTPSDLYYKLSPVNVSDNLTENKEIVIDDEVFNHNNITIYIVCSWHTFCWCWSSYK